MKRLRSILAFVVAAALSPAPRADACTTFLLERGKERLVGKSYDWDQGAGMVVVNKRGVAKQALLLDLKAKGASWVSRFGSLTFNQYGREMPNGGMNEAGLVVEIMWLDSTIYPKPNDRPAIGELQLIQYLLDTCGTIAEVSDAMNKVRVSPIYARVHYLACDKAGACASIEYLDGNLVMSSGSLPARVLTNSPYVESAKFLEEHVGFGGKKPVGASASSLDRFVRAASLVAAARKGKGALEQVAFAVLDSVAQGEFSRWNIVYDPARQRVSWRTFAQKKIKTVDVTRFDLGCGAPVKILDMDADLAGDVTARFEDYTLAANEKLVATSLGALGKGVPAGAAAMLARFPDALKCTTAR